MDFSIGLSQSQNQFDLIWVIMDKMTKSAHFLLVRTNFSFEDCARLHLYEIVKLDGVPVYIISDYGMKYTSHL